MSSMLYTNPYYVNFTYLGFDPLGSTLSQGIIGIIRNEKTTSEEEEKRLDTAPAVGVGCGAAGQAAERSVDMCPGCGGRWMTRYEVNGETWIMCRWCFYDVKEARP